jgi:hypothetical protein
MSLPTGQQATLAAMEGDLARNDPRLSGMLGVFAKLHENDGAPGTQVDSIRGEPLMWYRFRLRRRRRQIRGNGRRLAVDKQGWLDPFPRWLRRTVRGRLTTGHLCLALVIGSVIAGCILLFTHLGNAPAGPRSAVVRGCASPIICSQSASPTPHLPPIGEGP